MHYTNSVLKSTPITTDNQSTNFTKTGNNVRTMFTVTFLLITLNIFSSLPPGESIDFHFLYAYYLWNFSNFPPWNFYTTHTCFRIPYYQVIVAFVNECFQDK